MLHALVVWSIKVRVLLVENDQPRAAQLGTFLKAQGIHVEAINTGEEALDLVRHYEFDLMLLNLALLDMQGSSVISRMRAARHNTPVLAFSKAVSNEPRLKALVAGADDVVDLMIDRSELLARMRAIVRRSRGHSQPKIQIRAVTLDLEQQEVVANGTTLSLTGKEFAILHLLMMRKNMVLTKEAILTNLYSGVDEPEPKIIDVFICKLRKKLAGAGVTDVVGTVWGRGYTVRDQSEDRNTPNAPRIPQPVQQKTNQLQQV